MDSDQVRVIDMRSDTLTSPDHEMRQVMAEARVGDDVFGEDPTVNELQEKAARLFGMEAALFVPSGTMGNLLSIMSHCQGRGEEIVVGDKAHIFIYEQGGAAQIAGVQISTVANKADGTFDLDELENKIRPHDPFSHFPITKLICLENTHNMSSGRCIPLKFIQQVREIADRYDVKVHMDGARVCNAAVAQNQSVATILRHCHSVSMCLSKGLGAPIGSLMGGTKDFIQRAARSRKALGGGMRQSGILAAAGIMAIDQGIPRLHLDHQNTRKLAEGIVGIGRSLYSVDLENVETNMVYMEVGGSATAAQICHALEEVADEVRDLQGQGVSVKALPITKRTIRFVCYKQISLGDIDFVLKKLDFIAKKMT